MKEFEIRSGYLEDEAIETIYFGGGTPSLLHPYEAGMLLDKIYSLFKVTSNPEITFESNPEDLSYDYLSSIKNLGINRLSIGVQSFFDEDLKMMNRRHSSKQATDSIIIARNAGFNNISIDLIYGLPIFHISNSQSAIISDDIYTINKWKHNLDTLFSFKIPHVSAYHLSIEPSTVFMNFLKQGKISAPDESLSFKQFEILTAYMEKNGYIQYEISNFCRNGFFSIHNSNYWSGKKYLGVGPSSHSFNIDSRQWNVFDSLKYINAINQDNVPYEVEFLDNKTKYNDYILTSLRTRNGADLSFIEKNFGVQSRNHCLNSVSLYLKSGHADLINNSLTLSVCGKFISDRIISDLMFA
jgi:oxygen-independent coproporphyrinogen-3 oxidase